GDGFFGRAQVGLGHDLQQRRAAAVGVEQRIRNGQVVDQLAGILFHVDAGEADALARAVLQVDVEVTARANGLVIHRRSARLGDLVSLGQVGVEIVLARPHGTRLDVGAAGETQHDGTLHRPGVRNRQGSGEPEADGADQRVRFRAEFDAAAAEHLGVGGQLGMDFETDDDAVGHGEVRYKYKDKAYYLSPPCHSHPVSILTNSSANWSPAGTSRTTITCASSRTNAACPRCFLPRRPSPLPWTSPRSSTSPDSPQDWK